jgi:hypothetical protein
MKTATESFRVGTGIISISDPCYEPPTNVIEAKRGNWTAFVETIESFGDRVSKIIVHHEKFNPAEKLSSHSVLVPVDSGQVAVFDGERTDYASCCETTLSDAGYGYLLNGFATSSGYGDGCYECNILKNKNNKAVCVEITFIEE